jgi:peptidyl-prolyl cis-trans isomerase D
MMKFFRKHRNALMIVIAVLAIPFVFYFNKSDLSARGPRDFGHFYGRKVSAVEAQRYARLFNLAIQLGMMDFVQDLTAGAREDNERIVQFIFNILILHREADQLGVEPTSTERVDFVRNLPAFRGPSGFDLKKYTEFTQEMLAPYGFTDAQLEELAADSMALRRIKELVAIGVSVSESETKENYERAYGKITAHVIRLRTADFAKNINVTDDDVQKYFEAHKTEFKTEESRKVEFVSLALKDEQKKLTGKERVEPLQKLADRATDITQALLEKGADFHQVAAKFQLPVQATGDFAANKPDPKLSADPQLTANAFQLTKEEPNSEPIQVADGYYVLHLAGITPARPLNLEEARPKIVDAIKATRSREALTNKAAQAVHDIREGLKAGEPLNFAAEKANVKAEQVPPFTLLDETEEKGSAEKTKEKSDKPADLIAIKNAVASLRPGDVSEFYPWEGGGIIAVLEKRDPPDDAKYGGKKSDLTERVKTNKREIAFVEWLRQKQRDAGIVSDSRTEKNVSVKGEEG